MCAKTWIMHIWRLHEYIKIIKNYVHLRLFQGTLIRKLPIGQKS